MSFKDSVGTHDDLEVELAEYVKPRVPCPKCNKESKEHNVFEEGPDGPELVLGSRICSDRSCREEFNCLDS